MATGNHYRLIKFQLKLNNAVFALNYISSCTEARKVLGSKTEVSKRQVKVK
jgi:hypothetical protein